MMTELEFWIRCVELAGTHSKIGDRFASADAVLARAHKYFEYPKQIPSVKAGADWKACAICGGNHGQ